MPKTVPGEVLEQVIASIEAGQSDVIRSLLAALHPADTARMLDSLTPQQRSLVWPQVVDHRKGEWPAAWP